MFSPADSSSTNGYISYASSNSGSSGSDGERKKARKRISRSRRRQQQQQQQQQRKVALDSVQASIPFTTRFSPVSRADSFGSVSSLGEEVPTHNAVQHSPQAANESSSPSSDAEAEGDGDDLILPISSRSSTRWRAASSAADDVSSALESGTVKFHDMDNGFGAASTAYLPNMGRAGASNGSNNGDDDAPVGAR
eukprot:ctg_4992.g751